MKDKIRLIYNKIENRIDEICDDGFVLKENQQEYETLTDLEDFIDSLPEEPTSEEKSEKELAETYLAVFDKKYPILPTLKGKQKADFKNFLNKCQQEFGLKEFGIHPTQSKLFEKLTLLWAVWGAEHLEGLGKSNQDEFDKEPASEDLEEEIERCWKEMFPIGWSDSTLLTLTYEQHKAFARHFAEWQKQQMKEALQTEYEKGRFDMREEMMKNTVLETEVLMDCDGDGIETPYEEWLTLEDTEIPCVPEGFKEGDIVKVVLIKENLP